MTTNQTIDGVPRDLLERACVNIFRTTGGQKVVDELRALLDATTVESELDRLRAENERLLAGFYQQVTDADIKKISDYMGDPDMPTGAFLRQDAYDLANMTTHMCREVQALRNKLAAQPQGEPVAWLAQAIGKDGEVYRKKASTIEPTMRDIEIAWGQGVIDRFTIVIKPLYAEQPAPVAAAQIAGFNIIEDPSIPPGQIRMCDCNHGRMPCTCKPSAYDGFDNCVD